MVRLLYKSTNYTFATNQQLDQLQAAADRRRGELKQSTVLERRNYHNSILQLEYRTYPKTGKQRGPYWYFKWREDGRQRTLYVGQTDILRAVLRKD